jgi:hypothetical protein
LGIDLMAQARASSLTSDWTTDDFERVFGGL